MGKTRKPRRLGLSQKREFIAATWDYSDTGRFITVNGHMSNATEVRELIDWLTRAIEWMEGEK